LARPDTRILDIGSQDDRKIAFAQRDTHVMAINVHIADVNYEAVNRGHEQSESAPSGSPIRAACLAPIYI